MKPTAGFKFQLYVLLAITDILSQTLKSTSYCIWDCVFLHLNSWILSSYFFDRWKICNDMIELQECALPLILVAFLTFVWVFHEFKLFHCCKLNPDLWEHFPSCTVRVVLYCNSSTFLKNVLSAEYSVDAIYSSNFFTLSNPKVLDKFFV